jgi:hypothetical protein
MRLAALKGRARERARAFRVAGSDGRDHVVDIARLGFRRGSGQPRLALRGLGVSAGSGFRVKHKWQLTVLRNSSQYQRDSRDHARVAKNLILVAGYPKSGSTWVRFVFDTLRRGRAVSINDMEGGFYGARRRMLFDELAPVNAGELLSEEVDNLLPDVFRALSEVSGGPHIVKVHDKAHRTPSGAWLFPPECVRAVIYLTRHPFDVAPSYANHLGVSVPETIAILRRELIVKRPPGHLSMHLYEQWGSWSGNITSWLDATAYDVILTRYEDLHRDPRRAFSTLAGVAGISTNEAAVVRACDLSAFDRLRDEERSADFFERPRSSTAFFRAGKPRSWEGVLDAECRARLIEDHGTVMTRLGYDADGHAQALPEGCLSPAIA